MNGRYSIAVFALGCMVFPVNLVAQTDWPSFGNDPGATRYSPLKQINTGNVSQLKVAWTFDGTLEEAPPPAPPPVNHADAGNDGQLNAKATPAPPARRFARLNEAIPLVVDGVLYTCTAYRQIVAVDAETGKKIWEYNSPHPTPLRGISYWPGTTGFPPQIVYGTGDGWMISLDAKTGKPASTFGDNGMVNLKPGVVPDKYPNAARVGITSPLSFYKNYVFTGSSPGEFPTSGAAGDIRAWDMRTGKLVWTFHTLPRPGEANHDVWKDGQWEDRAGVNSWGFTTVDVQRGLVFVPIGTPNTDFYGGDRQGSNLLWNEPCGARCQHRKAEMVLPDGSIMHNWDYDDCAAPILITVKRGGKNITLP